MKLASVLLAGAPAFGAISEAAYIDLTQHFGDRCRDLRTLLASTELLDDARAYTRTAKATPLDGVRFLPLIPNADARMFALGWSYRDHQIETGTDAPEHPVIFSKHPQAMVGSGEPLIRPRISERFDYEGEIVVVIGRAGRNVPASSAMDHVAGYSIAMDGSIRDFQKHSVTAGKNFDASSSYGPWLVTADEIADPKAMELVTRLNGNEMQRTTFGLLAWEVGDLVAYVSTITKLEPGDSISTGTPAGVGHKRVPPVFLKAGDVVEVDVRPIGTLRNVVRDEA